MESSTRSRATTCVKPPDNIDFTDPELAGKYVVLTSKEDWSDPLNGNIFKLQKEQGRQNIAVDVFRDPTKDDNVEDIVEHGGMLKVSAGEENFVRVYWFIKKGESNKLQDSVVPKYVASDKYWAQSAPGSALAAAANGAAGAAAAEHAMDVGVEKAVGLEKGRPTRAANTRAAAEPAAAAAAAVEVGGENTDGGSSNDTQQIKLAATAAALSAGAAAFGPLPPPPVEQRSSGRGNPPAVCRYLRKRAESGNSRGCSHACPAGSVLVWLGAQWNCFC